MTAAKKTQTIQMSQLRAHIKGLHDKFLDQIPFNAWRFFSPSLSEVQFLDGQVSFNEADFFDVDERDFRECLEFWVTQAGGTIKWEKKK